MLVHAASAELPPSAKGAAIALGNFDGVHSGHQAVIAAARLAAQARGAPLAAAVFTPHPRRFFQADAPAFAVQSPSQRASALAALGVMHLFEIGFDAAMAQMSDADFAAQILAARLGAAHVSVGADFRFGRGRGGDAASLARLGAAAGFSVDAAAPVIERGEKISSSAIRAAISEGDMPAAARMLTRPWGIEGEVVRGFARGRGIGAPTANVRLGDYVRPRLGIYAVRVDIGDGAPRPGVASVGVNPTVGALPEPLLEAHLFDFDADLYGRVIEVRLIAFLRPEEKFDSVEAMSRQIEQDCARARAVLAS